MRKMWKLMGMICGTFLFAANPSPQPQLYVGPNLVYSCPNFIYSEGAVYLPYRESARALGVEVQVDSANQALYYRCGSILVIVDVRQKRAMVDGQVIPLVRSGIWVKDQVFVPEEVFTVVLSRALGVEIRIVYRPPPSAETKSPPVASEAGRAHPPATASESPSATPPAPADPAAGTPSGIRDPVDVIVLDAGHGGHDPGARGPGGLVEKEVTLTLAKKLRDRLREKGLTVFLTREDDTFVPLPRRPAIAREKRADVFLSIHANAHQRISAQGFETFFASLTATDKAASDLAMLENAADSGGTPAPVVGGEVGRILGDMAQAEVLADSERLAVLLQEEMAKSMNRSDRGVKQAPFRVLMDAVMPAALVEVGFLTSPEESKLITSPEIQDKIITALVAALLRYRDQTNARLGFSPATDKTGKGSAP